SSQPLAADDPKEQEPTLLALLRTCSLISRKHLLKLLSVVIPLTVVSTLELIINIPPILLVDIAHRQRVRMTISVPNTRNTRNRQTDPLSNISIQYSVIIHTSIIPDS